MTTSQRTEKVSPLDKFVVLAGDIDQLRNRIDQISTEQSIDDLLEVLEVEKLGLQFGVTLDTMRKCLQLAGGKVFKMGKKWVIRKVGFLEVLESLEQGNLS